jgi:hypothetical protein
MIGSSRVHAPRTDLPSHLLGVRVLLPQARVCRECGLTHGQAAARSIGVPPRRRLASRSPLSRFARWATTLEGRR